MIMFGELLNVLAYFEVFSFIFSYDLHEVKMAFNRNMNLFFLISNQIFYSSFNKY